MDSALLRGLTNFITIMLLLQISQIGSDDKEVIWGWLILAKRSSGDEEEDDQTCHRRGVTQQVQPIERVEGGGRHHGLALWRKRRVLRVVRASSCLQFRVLFAIECCRNVCFFCPFADNSDSFAILGFSIVLMLSNLPSFAVVAISQSSRFLLVVMSSFHRRRCSLLTSLRRQYPRSARFRIIALSPSAFFFSSSSHSASTSLSASSLRHRSRLRRRASSSLHPAIVLNP